MLNLEMYRVSGTRHFVFSSVLNRPTAFISYKCRMNKHWKVLDAFKKVQFFAKNHLI